MICSDRISRGAFPWFLPAKKDQVNTREEIPLINQPWLTSAGNASTPGRFLMASTKGVLALLTISPKDKVMLLGLWNSKYVATDLPQLVSILPNSRINPAPSWTRSSRLSRTKCQGNALQKVATPICRSVTAGQIRWVMVSFSALPSLIRLILKLKFLESCLLWVTSTSARVLYKMRAMDFRLPTNR